MYEVNQRHMEKIKENIPRDAEIKTAHITGPPEMKMGRGKNPGRLHFTYVHNGQLFSSSIPLTLSPGREI